MPLKIVIEGLLGVALLSGLAFLLTRKLWKPIGKATTKQVNKYKQEFADDEDSEQNNKTEE